MSAKKPADMTIEDYRMRLASYQGLVARVCGLLHLPLLDLKNTNIEPQRFAALEQWCSEQAEVNKLFGVLPCTIPKN
jgi:hypothetical protein